jgi:hypothetical protein
MLFSPQKLLPPRSAENEPRGGEEYNKKDVHGPLPEGKERSIYSS